MKWNKSRCPKITLHPLFIILGFVLVLLGRVKSFLICTLSACVHELGHFVVAEKYGYRMSKVRLMPYGAELHGDTDSFDGKDEIFIALAGPIVNLFICLFILSLWWITPRVYEFTHEIFNTNLVMGIFNLLPLFPLDGGRILLSILSRHTTRRNGAQIVKKCTRIFAVSLFIMFIASIMVKINLSLGIMAFMLFFSASNSAKDAVYQKIALADLVKNRCVQWVYLSIPYNMRVYELKRYHIKNRVALFLVLDEKGQELFKFSELELEKINLQVPQDTQVWKLKKILS